MIDLGKSLRKFLVSIDELREATTHQNFTKIFHGNIPQPPENYTGPIYPTIYTARGGTEVDDGLDSINDITRESFDVEFISDDLDQTQELSAILRQIFKDFINKPLGDIPAQAVFIDEHNDEYVPRTSTHFTDEGVQIATLNLTIIPDLELINDGN